MKQCDKGRNIVLKEFVHDALVIRKAFLIRLACSVGKNPRPCDRESISGYTHVLEQLHIFFVAVIGIIGDVARVPLKSLAGRV